MIDSIARLFVSEKASIEPQKAVTGPGAAVMSWGLPISQATNSAQQMMKEAQTVYSRGNRWVKRAEMVISNRVGGVKWHLETDDGETVTDESRPELRKIRDLIEKPLGGQDYARAFPNQPSTRRESWGVTSRHMGLCNVGFWMLDEIDAAIGWPQRIFMIRPDRMTPREDGARLVGWTLDKDAPGGGTDLSLDEVLPFYLDQPDKGYFGTGLVESILSTVGLPNAIDRHAFDTLSSGGRLPGLYAPKVETTNEVFDRLMTDLRVIKDMPDSSKRDVVARSPIEFTPTAADMSSLVVTALSQMSRDDTLTHWGVPLSTIGGQSPAGLNSGGSREYDEAALWQNAVGFRIVALKETLQFQFLDRLQALGMYVQIVIEEPSFDDDAPKYELAGNAVNLPLRNVERRALLGLDPFGDPLLDNAVWMPVNVVHLADAPDAATDTGKAKLDLTPIRNASTARITKDVAKLLSQIGKEVANRVRTHGDLIARKPADADVWMPPSKRKEWAAEFARALNPHLSLAAETVGAKVASQLGKTGKADPLGSSVLARLMKSVGTRISGILDTTRDDVKDIVERGIRDGIGAAELGDRIEAATTFGEYRAELIARSETATILNQAAAESYREFGITHVSIIDGDQDDECASADGQTWTLDEFAANPIAHPNCVRDASPVLGAA